jgi:pSer/pThr/pTyr-binding forkhead associated (FHA) protein
MEFEPIAVALKFGFLAVLYLFLLWVARSALKELRRTARGPAADETGIHLQATSSDRAALPREAWLVVERGAAPRPGVRFDLFGGLTIGRSPDADVRLDDPFASQIHARLYPHGSAYYVEDMGSTNGTYLNSQPLSRPEPLQPDDRVRIGEAEFRYEAS